MKRINAREVELTEDSRHDCQPADLEYQGEVGAPGFGQSWQCRECQAPWGRIGEHFFRHDENGEPSNILTLGDTR